MNKVIELIEKFKEDNKDQSYESLKSKLGYYIHHDKEIIEETNKIIEFLPEGSTHREKVWDRVTHIEVGYGLELHIEVGYGLEFHI